MNLNPRSQTVRVAIYLRQSLDRDQRRLAVERQREDCRALCERRGWTVVEEYVDNSISASSGKRRPAYNRMIADIGEGRVDAVVAWDADRLHRVPRELEDFIDLADQRKLALATVGGDFDLSTPTGRSNARLRGVFARMEVEQKAMRQLRAAKQKAERGEPQWRNAFGYMADGSRVPDPTTAPLVKQAYATIVAGGSISDVAREWNAAGALTQRWARCKDDFGELIRGDDGEPLRELKRRPWNAQLVSQFLRKPRNAGLREHRGVVVGPGNWTPLVDESTWRAAQDVLNGPGRTPGRKTVSRHLLTGVLRCGKPGCGYHLSGTQTTDRKRIAYTCKQCWGCSIRAEWVEPIVFGLISGRLAMPDASDLLRAQHDAEGAAALRAERNALLAQIDAAEHEYDDGVIDGRRLAGRIERVRAKLTDVERRENDAERVRVLDGLPLGRPEVADAIAALSPGRYRAVIGLVVELTIHPVGKGGRVFNPDRITYEWRR